MSTKIRILLITILALLPQFLCSSAALNGRSASSLCQFEEREETGGEYKLYVVKWYETLDDIAQKFGVSKEILIKFNSLDGEKLKRHQELKIPLNTMTRSETNQAEPVKILDTLNKKVDMLLDKVSASMEQLKNPKFSLVLPFNPNGEEVNHVSYEFYSGVLLALKDLSSEGKNVRLNVVDCSTDYSPLDFFLGENLIIGPLTRSGLESTLSRCTQSTMIVSPLDSRTVSLTENHANFFQAPSPLDCQYSDLSEWIESDLRSSDEILVLSEKGSAPSAIRDSLIRRNLKIKEYSYGLLEGREVLELMDSLVITPDITTRVVIASDNEAFVNDAVRNCALLTFKGHDVVLYSNSKIRNYDTIEPEDFHKLNAHICCSHYINYEDSHIKKFLLEYRALFEEEPTQFSFQGYDTAMYFLRSLLEGKNLEDYEGTGLQSDFRFRHRGDGYVNTAIRRIVYGDNYSVSILK